MRRVTTPRTWLVAALVVGGASLSFAESDPAEEARRIDDRAWFVRELDRGFEPFLADVDATLAALADAPADKVRPIRVTGDGARETVAVKSLAKGEPGEARALELFDQLARTAVDESKRPKHHAACADIFMTKADRAAAANDDTTAFECARSALGHVARLTRALNMIMSLGLKVALRSKEKEEYDLALDQLKSTIETLKANGATSGEKAVSDVEKVADEILKTTGPLSIAWLGDPVRLANVKGLVADFSRAVLTLTGPGKPMPTVAVDAKKPRRLRTGTFQVTAAGTNGGTWTGEVTITPQGGEFLVLRAQPDGMVYVPPLGSADAFLIDRAEVSNAQWTALSGEARSGRPGAPVAGVSFGQAKSWATLVGKQLPSQDHWSHAAFGAPRASSPRYPWGDAEPVAGTHWVSGTDEAQDVTSCPQGASRTSGCVNMAGNVWEWLDTGWLIGGSFKQSKLTRDCATPDGSPVAPWTADLLRNAAPTQKVYETLSAEDRDRYYSYKANDSTLEQAGLRCVVPLGKPWR